MLELLGFIWFLELITALLLLQICTYLYFAHVWIGFLRTYNMHGISWRWWQLFEILFVSMLYVIYRDWEIWYGIWFVHLYPKICLVCLLSFKWYKSWWCSFRSAFHPSSKVRILIFWFNCFLMQYFRYIPFLDKSRIYFNIWSFRVFLHFKLPLSSCTTPSTTICWHSLNKIVWTFSGVLI